MSSGYVSMYIHIYAMTGAMTHPVAWADSSCCVGCLSEVHQLVVSLRYVCIDAHMCINMNISV